MKEISIEICKLKINEKWDRFVEEIPGTSYEQTSRWGNASISNGFCNSHFRIILLESGMIVAGVQIFIRDYGRSARIGIIQQGPVFKLADEEIIQILVEEIKKAVKSEELLYLTIDVLYSHQSLPSYLLKAGFSKAHKRIPPIPEIESTLLLDLSLSVDDLMAQFDARRRRHLKLGAKFEYSTRVGTRDDLPVFFDLMNEACKRRDAQPLYDDIDYFYNVWDNLAPQGWVMLHIAEVDNTPVCAAFCYTFGDTFRYTQWGWNGSYGKEKISETFLWKNILWAKDNGFKYYDPVQLDPVAAKAILSGKEVPESIKNLQLFGATYFKMRWGGKVVFYPGLFTYYNNIFVKYTIAIISRIMPNYSTILKFKKVFKL